MGEGDSPGAAGPGCTAWGQYSLPELADFLPASFDAAWDHAGAWAQTAKVADTFRQTLQNIRDGFATIWPPERSPAATVYLSRLDSLIAALADMNETASSNFTALNGALTTLEGAKSTIDGLHEQSQTVDVTDSLALTRQGQAAMAAADNDLLPYYFKLRSPGPWTPGSGHGPDDSVPSDNSSSIARQGTLTQRPTREFVLPWLGRSSSGTPSSGSDTPDRGPLLTGGSASPLGDPAAPVGQPLELNPSDGPSPGAPGAPSWMVDTPAGRAMRYGAVIGEPPPTRSSGASGGSGAPQDEPRPVSPSRPSAPPGTGQPGDAAEPSGAGVVGGAGGAGRRSNQRRRRGSEPYHEWEVRQGVPPVIEPKPEPEHDPGPGVIGIDRW